MRHERSYASYDEVVTLFQNGKSQSQLAIWRFSFRYKQMGSPVPSRLKTEKLKAAKQIKEPQKRLQGLRWKIKKRLPYAELEKRLNAVHILRFALLLIYSLARLFLGKSIFFRQRLSPNLFSIFLSWRRLTYKTFQISLI